MKTQSPPLFASEPYAPDAALVGTELAGLRWGQRIVNVNPIPPFRQYLVYDTDDRHVLGSGSTPQDAAHSARMHLERRALTPADFDSRLGAYTFSTRVPLNSSVLEHLCLDATGRVVGKGDTKDEATSEAVRDLLMRAPIESLSIADFATVAVVVPVEYLRTQSRAVYTDTDERYQVKKALRFIYDREPGLDQRQTFQDFFVQAEQRIMLTFGKSPTQLGLLNFSFDEGQKSMLFVLANGVDRGHALKLAHQIVTAPGDAAQLLPVQAQPQV